MVFNLLGGWNFFYHLVNATPDDVLEDCVAAVLRRVMIPKHVFLGADSKAWSTLIRGEF